MGVLGLLVVAALAGVIQGGPLDPTSPPGSTQRPSADLQPPWSQDLPANNSASGPNPPAGCKSTRFKCVFNNEAVLDMETGLVWSRNAFFFGNKQDWQGSWRTCLTLFTGGKSGWHLASMEEMQSLSAPSPGTSWLPPGHPFTNLMTDDNYWTSTQVDANSVRVMARNGTSTQEIKTGMPPPANHAWCVRGGTGADALP